MKYKWNVTFIMKSGIEIKGIYESQKAGSMEVAKELFPENIRNGIGRIKTTDESEVLFYRQEEVAAFKIGVANK